MKLKTWVLPVGIILGFFFLYWTTLKENRSTNFRDLALGEETTSIYSSKTINRAVHCRDLTNINICLEDYQKIKTNMPVILWLGNSQIHAINKFSNGEETATPELHRRFFELGHYFLTFSQANASLQEHYLFFAYLLDHFPIKKLILPLVFDDMREEGIRKELSDALNHPNTIQLLTTSKIGTDLINAGTYKSATNYNLHNPEGTLQGHIEDILNTNLESVWLLWAERPKLRARIFNYLYQIRNTILGINSSSIRKIIPGRYDKNIKSLNAILDLASRYQVQVMLYIAPLRNDVKTPYNLNEYNSFKSNVLLIAQKHKVALLNFEGLIPSELWGSRPSNYYTDNLDLDFMHFQEGGHRLLADEIFRELIELDVNP